MSFSRHLLVRLLWVPACALCVLALGSSPASAADTTPPTAPLLTAAVTQNSVTLTWRASTDNVAVLGYHVMKNGASMGNVTASTLSKGIAYLACGTQYSFGVYSYDTRYNDSTTSTITTVTSPCASGAGDTTAPSTPTAPLVSSASATGFVLAWGASTDNVGVTAYDVFRDGVRAASTSALGYTFTGLVCGTVYALAVSARDAAGNVSPVTSVRGQTAACPSDGGTPSSGLSVKTSGSGMASGLSVKTPITSGGQTRKYLTYKSSGLVCGPRGCPLVVYLGGSVATGCQSKTSFDLMMDCDLGTTPTGAGQIGSSGWTTEANAVGAIVLVPEGAPNTCFNNGNCKTWGGSTSDDGQFIKDAVQQVETNATIGASINPSKIYLTGFSAGGSATSWIACGAQQGTAAPTSNFKIPQSLFAGFGIEAGGQLGIAPIEAIAPACSWPTSPKPTIITTSKGDSTAGYDPAGHQKFVCSTVAAGSTCFLRTPTTANAYATKWGCHNAATTTVAAGGGYVSYDHQTYDSCTSTGAAFEWDSLGTSLTVGPTHSLVEYNQAVNVPDLYWTFWMTH